MADNRDGAAAGIADQGMVKAAPAAAAGSAAGNSAGLLLLRRSRLLQTAPRVMEDGGGVAVL